MREDAGRRAEVAVVFTSARKSAGEAAKPQALPPTLRISPFSSSGRKHNTLEPHAMTLPVFSHSEPMEPIIIMTEQPLLDDERGESVMVVHSTLAEAVQAYGEDFE